MKWRRFGRTLLLWLASSFGLGLLPLGAHCLVATDLSIDPELCLFIMVLCGTGAFDALAEHNAEGILHAALLILGIVGSIFGALGYGELTANIHDSLPESLLVVKCIVPMMVIEVAVYTIYKVKLLWNDAYRWVAANVQL